MQNFFKTLIVNKDHQGSKPVFFMCLFEKNVESIFLVIFNLITFLSFGFDSEIQNAQVLIS